MNIKITTKAFTAAAEKLAAAENNARVLKSDKYERMAETARAEYAALLRDLVEPIEAALAKVNGKANAFTITRFQDVLAFADQIEALLDARGLSKADRVGVVAGCQPAGPTSNAYKFAARSTHITMRRVADGWRLTDIGETTVYPKAKETCRVWLSDAQKAKITAYALSPFA